MARVEVEVVAVDRATNVLQGIFQGVGQAAFNAAAQGVQAFVGGMTDSIKAAGDFEASLNVFQSVAGDSLQAAGLEVKDLSDLFLDMGAKTQFSAGQAAEAAIELVKGGIDPATIAAGALEQALGLAAAGGLELGTASGIMAKQLGVWGDTGVTAAQVSDLLAQAANASTVDVDELALGLANVGGSAKVAGASFEETVQALALLAPGFSSASDAGTSLKTFLSRLVPSTDKAREAMDALGLTRERVFEDGSTEMVSAFFDEQGAFIGMEEAARLLQTATKDLSEEQKLQAFNTIFGSDAIRAAAMLAEAGAEGFNEMGTAMAGAGSAAEQAAIRNQGFAFAIESLKGSLETVQIVIGTALLPILTELVNNYVIPAVNAFLDWAQNAMPLIIAGLQQFGGIILNILSTVDFGPLLAAFAALFDAMGIQMPAAGDVFAAVGAALIVIIQGLADFLNNFLIPTLTAVVQWVTANWPTIQATFEAVMAAIQTVVTNVLTAIQTFWNEWGDDIMGQVKFFTDQWQNIFAMFAAAFEGDWHKFGELLRVGMENAWEAVVKAFNTGVQAVLAIDWGGVGAAIVKGIGDGIAAWVGYMVDQAVKAAMAVKEAVEGFFGIQSPSKVFAEIGKNTMAGMAQGIHAGAGLPINAARGVSNSVVNNSGGNSVTNNYYGVQADMRLAYDRATGGAF